MGVYGKARYGFSRFGESQDFIYDRTERDLIQNTERAYINAEDLNRIEEGMKVIADRNNIQITTKTDWKEAYSSIPPEEFPIKPHMERIIGNLNTLINKIGYSPTVEVPTSFENMTIYKINNLEYILDEIIAL